MQDIDGPAMRKVHRHRFLPRHAHRCLGWVVARPLRPKSRRSVSNQHPRSPTCRWSGSTHYSTDTRRYRHMAVIDRLPSSTRSATRTQLRHKDDLMLILGAISMKPYCPGCAFYRAVSASGVPRTGCVWVRGGRRTRAVQTADTAPSDVSSQQV